MSNDQAFPFHRRKGLRRPYYVAPHCVRLIARRGRVARIERRVQWLREHTVGRWTMPEPEGPEVHKTVIGYWGDAWLTTITTQTPPNPPKTP